MCTVADYCGVVVLIFGGVNDVTNIILPKGMLFLFREAGELKESFTVNYRGNIATCVC